MLRLLLKGRFRGTRGRLLRAGADVKRRLIRILLSFRHFWTGLGPSVAGTLRRQPPRKLSNQRRVFGQGLVIGFGPWRILGWNLFHRKPLIVVVINARALDTDGYQNWSRRTRRLLGATFVLHDDSGEALRDGVWSIRPAQVRQEVIRQYPQHDVVFVDGREALPDPTALVALKYGAYRSGRARRVGLVAPSRISPTGERWSGIDWERQRGRWIAVTDDSVRDYGQNEVPRFVLAEQIHGLYITTEAIHAIRVSPDGESSWDALAGAWIREAWRMGLRTLVFPAATIQTQAPALDAQDPTMAAEWLARRRVRDHRSRLRVVFVLPATTLSGGIRAVLELAEGLAQRDVDVEVWALGGHPTWTEVHIPVVEFMDYSSLLDALAPLDAIKVATWWETAEVVWLASVEHGVPVQFVQEFESWFYPDDRSGQAAVAACYRREFAYTTTAEFQHAELAEIGIDAEIVPPAFDDRVFRVHPEVSRRDDTLLALGRSFFQKNFALTLRAWRSLGERRPRLELFGIEPGIATDSRIHYTTRPTDTEVAALYSGATAFIQTSRHEGFSLPIVEAMACGCPVITTDSHGNRFCVPEVNCLMVEQDDAAGAASAIERLMGDPELQERLRTAGYETARKYTWPVVLEASHEFYRRVAREAEGGDS